MIDDEGGTSVAIQADVTNAQACENAVARTVELFGAVHILVNIGKPSTCQQLLHT
jgi:NAD(P)-dependent dehydrogenase (short-subunit alcohol dehydrogenase family)